ncbi:MAG: ABC-F family ATP-binding cassette domain-containing protein [Ruminococcus sp.]|nr:ABC-F family ATP-binding cassette domain-containing protein [Ruminococcus sp.]
MIQIKNLTIVHKKDTRVILEDFSCVLGDGDKAVIIGEEGNGKSTLLQWLYSPDRIGDYCEARGERFVRGHRMGYLPQELPGQEKEKSVYEYFMEESMFLEQDPKDLNRMAREFGLPVDFFYREQPMGTLSGGEKVKAQLLRLLVAEPDVLLLDEPSNDIDLDTLEWLETMILGWKGIVLFISHDETLIEHTANMVIHIEQIRRKMQSRHTVVHMPYLQYRRERLAQFENQERKAANDRREKKLREEKYMRVFQSVDHAQAVITRQNPSKARLLKKKMHAIKSMERRFAREDAQMTEMPEEEDAIFFKLGDETAKLPSKKTVLDLTLERLDTPDGERVLSEHIRLLIRGCEKLCIVGTNGAGKTTLLCRIAEELLSRKDLHAEYMPQNYEELLDPSSTPVDYLSRTGDKKEQTKIRTFLGALKYTADEMDHQISQLSGGQKAKLFLLKMSLSGANVLILDEPTRNFSPLSGPVIRQMLKDFPGAVISISHDRKYIAEVCDKVCRLTQNGLEILEPDVQAALSVRPAASRS